MATVGVILKKYSKQQELALKIANKITLNFHIKRVDSSKHYIGEISKRIIAKDLKNKVLVKSHKGDSIPE